MSEEALAANAGLARGDLRPLADYLRACDGDIHFVVARALARAIDGDPKLVHFKLEMKQAMPAGKGGAKKTRQAKLDKQWRQFDIARVMRKHGAHISSRYESAVTNTKRDTGLGKTTIAEAWSQQKFYIAMQIAHKLLEDPYSP